MAFSNLVWSESPIIPSDTFDFQKLQLNISPEFPHSQGSHVIFFFLCVKSATETTAATHRSQLRAPRLLPHSGKLRTPSQRDPYEGTSSENRVPCANCHTAYPHFE